MQITLQITEDKGHRFGRILVGGATIVPATLDPGLLPYGHFSWKKVISPKRGLLVIELDGAPGGHSNIQCHVGNTLSDSEGCVLLGTSRGLGVNVINSCAAYLALMKSVKDAASGEFVVEKVS